MTTANHSTNQQPHGLGNLVQIIEGQEQFKTRDQIESMLDDLEGANLAATIRQLNGLKRGGYRVTIKQDAEYNEVQCRLWENTTREPIATGFIDRGHTTQTKYEAAEELRGLVRAYLCR